MGVAARAAKSCILVFVILFFAILSLGLAAPSYATMSVSSSPSSGVNGTENSVAAGGTNKGFSETPPTTTVPQTKPDSPTPGKPKMCAWTVGEKIDSEYFKGTVCYDSNFGGFGGEQPEGKEPFHGAEVSNEYAVLRAVDYFYDYGKGYDPAHKVRNNPCPDKGTGVEAEWCSTHTFIGWSLDQKAMSAQYFSGDAFDNPPLGEILYAVWLEYTINVAFHANGGAEDTAEVHFEVVKAPDYKLTMPQKVFSKKGYALSSWNTAPDGSGTSYKFGETVDFTKVGTKDLYAQWKLAPGTDTDTDTDVDKKDPDNSKPLKPNNPKPNTSKPNLLKPGTSKPNSSQHGLNPPTGAKAADSSKKFKRKSGAQVLVLPRTLARAEAEPKKVEVEQPPTSEVPRTESQQEPQAQRKQADPYEEMHLKSDSDGPEEEQFAKASNNAGVAVAVASVIFVIVTVSFFPRAVGAGFITSKTSWLSKLFSAFHH